MNLILNTTSRNKLSAPVITSYGIFHILPELLFGFPLSWNHVVVQILYTLNVYSALLTVIGNCLVNKYMKYVIKTHDSRFHRNSWYINGPRTSLSNLVNEGHSFCFCLQQHWMHARIKAQWSINIDTWLILNMRRSIPLNSFDPFCAFIPTPWFLLSVTLHMSLLGRMSPGLLEQKYLGIYMALGWASTVTGDVHVWRPSLVPVASWGTINSHSGSLEGWG